MKFCKSFGVLFLGLGCSIAAHAQLGVYATATGNWFGGVTCPSFASPCADNSGKVKPFGGNFGVYYDFRNIGPVRLGVDLRGSDSGSNKRADSSAGGSGVVRQYEVLGGPRVSFHTPVHWLHPYAEIAAGYGRNNASGLYTATVTGNTNVAYLTFNPATYTGYGLVKGFVGVDIPLLPFLSFRAVELGEGVAFGSSPTLQTTTTTSSGTTTMINTRSSDTHGVQSIGSGIVITLPFGK